MRQFNFEEHLKRKKEFTIYRLQKGRKKLPRRKEKDLEELKIIIELIKERRKRMFEEGSLEKIDKRKWRLKL